MAYRVGTSVAYELELIGGTDGKLLNAIFHGTVSNLTKESKESTTRNGKHHFRWMFFIFRP